MRLHALVPEGFATAPTGGNRYDRRVLAGLATRGWTVQVHEVSPAGVGPAVAPLRSGDVVLVDGLVASWAPEVLLRSPARVVPLVHSVFGTPQEGELLATAPVLITTSAWTRDLLVADYAVDPRRIRVATPGVDRASHVSGSAAGDRLLCVAALTATKGQDVLLAALARLRDLDWRCTLVGSPDRDPVLVDELRKRAADGGVADRVRFAGELVGSELEAAYAAADLLVLPSFSETYGLVVTEALARGLPVVASRIGGVPEAMGELPDGSHPGMLVRPGSPVPLARALRRWLEDDRLRRTLRRRARARLPDLLPWSRTTADVVRALEVTR